MRRIVMTITMAAMLVMVAAPQKVEATPIVVIKAVVKKVIKAMDLMVQRLQNETIRLQNLQKTLENTMSKLKLDEIFSWGQQQWSLFSGYYDELWKVRSLISQYQKVRAIVRQQVRVVEEYNRAAAMINRDKNFSAQELLTIMDIYAGILQQSLQNVEGIVKVVTSFSLQMSDAARLQLIDHTKKSVDNNLTHLRAFTDQNITLSMQRTKNMIELNSVKRLYGIQ